MFDKLIYTNSTGQSIEFSTSSVFFCNIKKDVKGLTGTKTTLYRSQIVDVDGEIETGFHVEAGDIQINGKIQARNYDEYVTELEEVFSPFYTGILRYEGKTTKEIDVRVESAPNMTDSRWPSFSIDLIALNPNWRATSETEASISAAGTTIFYEGSKACGLEIEITALADNVDMESLTITNGTNVETVTFRTAGGVELDTNDVLLLTTIPGVIDILLNDVTALERVDFDNTIFPQLYPGNNVITWAAYGDEASFTVDVRYTPLYLGR